MAGELHVRTQIRRALVARLTNAVDGVHENVFTSRVRPLKPSQVPAIDVDLKEGGEADELERSGKSRAMGGFPILTLTYTVKRNDGCQDEIDEIDRQVRVLIYDLGESLGGLVKKIIPAGEPEYEDEDEGDETIARAVVRYKIFYATPANAPHTPR